MAARESRRRFLQTTATGSMALGLADFAFLNQLPPVSAADAKLDPKVVRLQPEIEPLVRFLEETPRNRLLEETADRIRRGLNYQELLAALLLAGVRNVEPRPAVGFKFHAVLVVNSAHLASIASPDSERWLPIFWALDHFKESQAQNIKERQGWRMRPVKESALPPARRARQAFIAAMDKWDEEAADAAVASLVRSAGANEVFELLYRYAPRDFRDIGHKIIFAANSRRTLACIGWQHAEPVLRSLTYAMLKRGNQNPAQSNDPADAPGRRNRELIGTIRTDWQTGKITPSATLEILEVLRQGSEADVAKKVAKSLNDGVAPQSIWDALLDGAGELLMRKPGIVALHAVTTSNAARYAFEDSGDDDTRRFILLQNASFVTLFRNELQKQGALPDHFVEQLEPLPLKTKGQKAVEEILADVSGDRMTAARKTISYLKENPQPKELLDAARVLIFTKGSNSHDYKFSSAVLEDYYNVSPAWRDKYLATSVFNLRGSQGPDNGLVKRIRAALKT